MLKKILSVTLISLIPFLSNVVLGQDTLLNILQKELGKIDQTLKKQELPPYFIDFRLNELKTTVIQYSSGNLVRYEIDNHNRVLSIGLRIGNYKEDNTSSQTDMEGGDQALQNITCQLPLDNDSVAIAQIVRSDVDLAYKNALQQYKALQTNKNAESKKEKAPAFSMEEVSHYYEAPTKMNMGQKELDGWKKTLKDIASLIEQDTNIVISEVILGISNERIYYINNEGSSIVQNRPQYQIQFFAGIRTTDDNIAPLFKSYVVNDLQAFPSYETMIADTREMMNHLNALRNAPIAEPYAGPSIFSNEAAGVIFHEIFGHRIEGQRLRNEYDGQTFLDKQGKKVLDSGLTILFDPTLKEFEGKPLFGSYKYDDQGVKSQPVTIVNKGILVDFLMSRTPIKNHEKSNGHGRAQAGMAPFSRQSNLIVKFSSGETDANLRKMLIKESKKQGKAYGYFIKEVYGGFTNTMVFSPQVFNILPTLVYRVYADGRPDELVRGVNFIGTPLTVFSEIIANGNQYGIFNGFCGAESGSVPVSTVCPQLLIKKIETQKIPETKLWFPSIKKPE
ncbi:MAG TPA: TldD/PmbA family protein [Bacteroidales bacterium]|nr:TldD/PmbA family protein [Bacteroidales bacterium]